jgi:hypothetical protein
VPSGSQRKRATDDQLTADADGRDSSLALGAAGLGRDAIALPCTARARRGLMTDGADEPGRPGSPCHCARQRSWVVHPGHGDDDDQQPGRARTGRAWA